MTIPVDHELKLRSFQTSDVSQLFACVSANRAHLREFLPWVDATLKEADSLAFIDTTIKQQTAQEGMAMGIFLNDQLIGSIGMHTWDHRLKKCEIGYWLVEDRQNQGYMYRSAVAFLDFLFHRLELNKVEIRFLPFNSRSGSLAQKLGGKVEGVLRDNYKINGSFEDTVVIGILNKEWKARPKQ
jgi:ribosomal-protein-serine acetyltransferase